MDNQPVTLDMLKVAVQREVYQFGTLCDPRFAPGTHSLFHTRAPREPEPNSALVLSSLFSSPHDWLDGDVGSPDRTKHSGLSAHLDAQILYRDLGLYVGFNNLTARVRCTTAGLNDLSRRYAHLVLIQQLRDMVVRLTSTPDFDPELARTGGDLGVISSVLALEHSMDAARMERAQVIGEVEALKDKLELERVIVVTSASRMHLLEGRVADLLACAEQDRTRVVDSDRREVARLSTVIKERNRLLDQAANRLNSWRSQVLWLNETRETLTQRVADLETKWAATSSLFQASAGGPLPFMPPPVLPPSAFSDPLHMINVGNVFGTPVTAELSHKRHIVIVARSRVGTVNSPECVLGRLTAQAEVVFDVEAGELCRTSGSARCQVQGAPWPL